MAVIVAVTNADTSDYQVLRTDSDIQRYQHLP